MKASKRFAVSLAATVVALAVAPAGATSDPLYAQQWNLTKVGFPTAWTTNSGAGVKIAIIDTGVDLQHVDLKTKLDPGRNFADNPPNSNAQDVNGHGTAVAGIAAAATNNGLGVAGAAPLARIVPIRIANAAGQSVGDAIAQAMEWAVDVAKVDVINLSFGADNLCVQVVEERPADCVPAGPLALIPGLDDSISYAFAMGALVVVSAGNESAGFCSYPGFSPFALCVGASDRNDGIASYSNRGVRVDVVAPGVDITTTYYTPGGAHNVYATYVTGGTSLAAPLVAGVGALLMSMGASNAEAMQLIKCTAKDLGPAGYDLTFGWGRVSANGAVAARRAGGIC